MPDVPIPGREAAFRVRIESLEKRTKKLAEMAQQIADEVGLLWQDVFLEMEPGKTLKRRDGRLTDEGVRAINDALASGATVMEVSRTYEISPSAASQRRRIWEATKALEKPPQETRKTHRKAD